mmetsp:Transcript_49552/g.152957  ORF Transcript_49552/g.152957 Transcript_49552/m.152957 type:complete len:290 (+) Transcript_49552:199-1068(+)
MLPQHADVPPDRSRRRRRHARFCDSHVARLRAPEPSLRDRSRLPRQHGGRPRPARSPALGARHFLPQPPRPGPVAVRARLHPRPHDRVRRGGAARHARAHGPLLRGGQGHTDGAPHAPPVRDVPPDRDQGALRPVHQEQGLRGRRRRLPRGAQLLRAHRDGRPQVARAGHERARRLLRSRVPGCAAAEPRWQGVPQCPGVTADERRVVAADVPARARGPAARDRPRHGAPRPRRPRTRSRIAGRDLLEASAAAHRHEQRRGGLLRVLHPGLGQRAVGPRNPAEHPGVGA